MSKTRRQRLAQDRRSEPDIILFGISVMEGLFYLMAISAFIKDMPGHVFFIFHRPIGKSARIGSAKKDDVHRICKKENL